ncbi:MAG: carboxylating nicotinate-nucleotide diphosphorylase [Acidobacteria bacterium]|nr:carboxylating nicotinate-nucleotide diphosphorylase [Acidobacteriota bacterium]
MTDGTNADRFLRLALEEDLGDAGDITSSAVVPEGTSAQAHVVARSPGIIAGLGVMLRTFTIVDPEVHTESLVQDGTLVDAGSLLAIVTGSARSLLAAERVALNLLGQLSGVATATRELVDQIAGTNASLVDTRKTVPGLRALQKAAVQAGGGQNHRMGLYDAVLIKDNHIAVAGSVEVAVEQARAAVGPGTSIEIEVESTEQLEAAIAAGADIVMLDNMSVNEMREAVLITDGRCRTEASGGIMIGTVREVAKTGVDMISVGWITHSAPALDVALDLEYLEG